MPSQLQKGVASSEPGRRGKFAGSPPQLSLGKGSVPLLQTERGQTEAAALPKMERASCGSGYPPSPPAGLSGSASAGFCSSALALPQRFCSPTPKPAPREGSGFSMPMPCFCMLPIAEPPARPSATPGRGGLPTPDPSRRNWWGKVQGSQRKQPLPVPHHGGTALTVPCGFQLPQVQGNGSALLQNGADIGGQVRDRLPDLVGERERVWLSCTTKKAPNLPSLHRPASHPEKSSNANVAAKENICPFFRRG